MSLIGEMNYLTIGNSTYEIADETARSMELVATYTPSTYDLELNFESPNDSDNEEF